MCTIVWFRRDLRIEDNPALIAASRLGPVLPVFIWSPEEEGQFYPGRVSRWWLKQSLRHLAGQLAALGSPLVFRRSACTYKALLELAALTGAARLFYNHLYDPVSLVRDHKVKGVMGAAGVVVSTFNADLLYEPWEVYDSRGCAFTSFDSFWTCCLNMPHSPDPPVPGPKSLVPPSVSLAPKSPDSLQLENEEEAASNALLARAWLPGCANAERALVAFLCGPLLDYAANRSKADSATTSLLSPHMHFGEISSRKVFHEVRRMESMSAAAAAATAAAAVAAATADRAGRVGGDGPSQPPLPSVAAAEESARGMCESMRQFLRSLGLREYSRYVAFNFPFTHERSLLSNLKNFPWRVDEVMFKAWRQGRTGYPLVDAGMRELWATGWMHNRIRIVVASFCVKFLQLPWRWGMKYFWDSLLDADLECDVLGWQYISGSLPDGHELDRMEHPEVEGYKHDPDGEYVRRWLPELSRVPTEWIHHPSDAPPGVLRNAGVELGCTYPRPIVEVETARRRLQHALEVMWQCEMAATALRDNGREEGSGENDNAAELDGVGGGVGGESRLRGDNDGAFRVDEAYSLELGRGAGGMGPTAAAAVDEEGEEGQTFGSASAAQQVAVAAASFAGKRNVQVVADGEAMQRGGNDAQEEYGLRTMDVDAEVERQVVEVPETLRLSKQAGVHPVRMRLPRIVLRPELDVPEPGQQRQQRASSAPVFGSNLPNDLAPAADYPSLAMPAGVGPPPPAATAATAATAAAAAVPACSGAAGGDGGGGGGAAVKPSGGGSPNVCPARVAQLACLPDRSPRSRLQSVGATEAAAMPMELATGTAPIVQLARAPPAAGGGSELEQQRRRQNLQLHERPQADGMVQGSRGEQQQQEAQQPPLQLPCEQQQQVSGSGWRNGRAANDGRGLGDPNSANTARSGWPQSRLWAAASAVPAVATAAATGGDMATMHQREQLTGGLAPPSEPLRANPSANAAVARDGVKSAAANDSSDQIVPHLHKASVAASMTASAAAAAEAGAPSSWTRLAAAAIMRRGASYPDELPPRIPHPSEEEEVYGDQGRSDAPRSTLEEAGMTDAGNPHCQGMGMCIEKRPMTQELLLGRGDRTQQQMQTRTAHGRHQVQLGVRLSGEELQLQLGAPMSEQQTREAEAGKLLSSDKQVDLELFPGLLGQLCDENTPLAETLARCSPLSRSRNVAAIERQQDGTSGRFAETSQVVVTALQVAGEETEAPDDMDGDRPVAHAKAFVSERVSGESPVRKRGEASEAMRIMEGRGKKRLLDLEAIPEDSMQDGGLDRVGEGELSLKIQGSEQDRPRGATGIGVEG